MNLKKNRVVLAGCALVSVLAVFAVAQELPKAKNAQDKNCLACHVGIESIGGKMDDLACVTCHKGNPNATSKEAAHDGMHRNPGDYSVAQETCGACHPDHLRNSLKSLHATSAGIISGARYLWAAQPGRGSVYGNKTVKDDDGDVPKGRGGLEKLDALPTFAESGQHIDDYLRKECLRCHLGTEGKKSRGDYRASGCTACHMPYSDEGLSQSGDPTIPKNKPGHPVRHVITTRIPAEQCLHCHNRGGRTGVSYIGTMEADPYGTPFTKDGGKQAELHGKHYNHLQKDIHYEKGMMCIDCHTSRELHGDGNIYGKKEEAVEIRCENCHGTVDKRSDLKTAWGNKIENVRREGGKVVLKSKYSGKDHSVTQLTDLAAAGRLPPAMAIPAHKTKLECYSCHSRWTPQCYGCHAKRDDRETAADWLSGEKTAGKWTESRSYLRWETPVLGINTKGKVSPYVPGCQAIFTHIDKDGKTVSLNKIFTTSHGQSGLSQNPIQPHTISSKARTCEDCHSNPKALGLGTGTYVLKDNGLDVPFELERIVDEQGRQLQATAHDGARPFDKEELARISRVNVCLACHKDMVNESVWKKVTDVTGFARTDEKHAKILNSLLPKR